MNFISYNSPSTNLVNFTPVILQLICLAVINTLRKKSQNSSFVQHWCVTLHLLHETISSYTVPRQTVVMKVICPLNMSTGFGSWGHSAPLGQFEKNPLAESQMRNLCLLEIGWKTRQSVYMFVSKRRSFFPSFPRYHKKIPIFWEKIYHELNLYFQNTSWWKYLGMVHKVCHAKLRHPLVTFFYMSPLKIV